MSTPHLRQATSKDVDRCYQIEISAYEGDEAATREKIATRIAQYPEGFLVLEFEGVVIGFINSGCAFDVVMSDESFKELVGHDAQAPNVVIMSVVVDPAFQGRGFAGLLMSHFVDQMRQRGAEDGVEQRRPEQVAWNIPHHAEQIERSAGRQVPQYHAERSERDNRIQQAEPKRQDTDAGRAAVDELLDVFGDTLVRVIGRVAQKLHAVVI